VCFDEFCFRTALARPALSQVWRDRVLRAHHLSNRHYTNYIQPDLLFRHSFGPEPSAIVLTLIQANEKSECSPFLVFDLIAVSLFLILVLSLPRASHHENQQEQTEEYGGERSASNDDWFEKEEGRRRSIICSS
jgi:hypothetical protein